MNVRYEDQDQWLNQCDAVSAKRFGCPAVDLLEGDEALHLLQECFGNDESPTLAIARLQARAVNKQHSYWIQIRAGSGAPKPPIKSMTYYEASRWVARQAPGNQLEYSIELSALNAY